MFHNKNGTECTLLKYLNYQFITQPDRNTIYIYGQFRAPITVPSCCTVFLLFFIIFFCFGGGGSCDVCDHIRTVIYTYSARCETQLYIFATINTVHVCVCLGKLGSEDDTKDEFRIEREPPATHEEGTACLRSNPVFLPSEDLSSLFVSGCLASWRLALRLQSPPHTLQF